MATSPKILEDPCRGPIVVATGPPAPGTMNAFRRLIHEIHRRSLWQVVSIYLVGSWGALQVADQVTQSAGLPDWVPRWR